jgi:hypothetical protein
VDGSVLLVLATADVLGFEFRGAHNHILLSHIQDSPSLISPKYLRALGFDFPARKRTEHSPNSSSAVASC